MANIVDDVSSSQQVQIYNLMSHTLLYLIKAPKHLHGWTSILWFYADIVQELFHACMERNKQNEASYVNSYVPS